MSVCREFPNMKIILTWFLMVISCFASVTGGGGGGGGGSGPGYGWVPTNNGTAFNTTNVGINGGQALTVVGSAGVSGGLGVGGDCAL